MIVVSDTSPLNYLLLIGQVDVLPTLFGRVLAPPAVVTELLRAKAPDVVKQWAKTPPTWLEVKAPATVAIQGRLGPGETEAIALAQEMHADTLLMDDRDGVAAAQRMGLSVTGVLGVLRLASEYRLLDLAQAFAALRQTTFRGPEEIMDRLLRDDTSRKSDNERT